MIPRMTAIFLMISDIACATSKANPPSKSARAGQITNPPALVEIWPLLIASHA